MSEETVLRSIVEAFINVPDDVQGSPSTYYSSKEKSLFRLPATDEVVSDVLNAIKEHLPPSKSAQLLQLLRLMDGAFTCGIFTGVPFRKFSGMSLQDRQRCLYRLSQSHSSQLRGAFKALKSLSAFMFYSSPKTGAWDVLGYSQDTLASRGKPVPSRVMAQDEIVWRAQIDVSDSLRKLQKARDSAGRRAVLAHVQDTLRSHGVPSHAPSKLSGEDLAALKYTLKHAHEGHSSSGGFLSRMMGHHAHSHAHARSHDESDYFGINLVVDEPDLFDAVIVGSGGGGGVAAHQLSAHGMRVLVLEKGVHSPAAKMDEPESKEKSGFETLYEQAGLFSSADASVAILAGSTLGGGTTINWAASWTTPDHVKLEWATEYGLEAFRSAEYEEALLAVSTRLGISDNTIAPAAHNISNASLISGMNELHDRDVAANMPRNCAEPDCSSACCFGCPRAAKMSTLTAFLTEAFDQFEAKVMTNCCATHIVTQHSKQPNAEGKHRTVVGLLVELKLFPHANTADAPEAARPLLLFIKAPKVVVSCGSLHSPALLLRSGITNHGQVGKNLRLHPAMGVWGWIGSHTDDSHGQTETEPHSPLRMHSLSGGPVPSWDGPMMSAVSRYYENFDGDSYGFMLTTPVSHPGLTSAQLVWASAAQHKWVMANLANHALFLTITRDHEGGGHVTLGEEGRPEVHYWPTPQDQHAMLTAQSIALRSLAAAGATMVGAVVQDERLWSCETKDKAALEDYIKRVEAAGLRKNVNGVLSAHQMGTCRMGVNPKKSVVDPDGHCWEVEGLYVADASVFPTSLGVNPMVTVLAVAYMTMRRLGRKFAATHVKKDSAHRSSLGHGSMHKSKSRRISAEKSRRISAEALDVQRKSRASIDTN